MAKKKKKTSSSKSSSASAGPHITPGVIVGFLALVIIVIIVIVLLPRLQIEGPTEERPQEVVEKNPAGVLIPNEIFSRVGIVAEKDGNVLMLAADAESNYLVEDRTLRITVTPQTEIVRLVIPLGLPEGTEFTPEEEPISFGEIEIGEELEAYAETNIKQETDYTATRIEIVDFRRLDV